ncbi:hypothetical protein EIL50_03065 [bacterium NHP-B]|nr:hypothetical protein EIL50_03065 [bacterium NHP-B]
MKNKMKAPLTVLLTLVLGTAYAAVPDDLGLADLFAERDSDHEGGGHDVHAARAPHAGGGHASTPERPTRAVTTQSRAQRTLISGSPGPALEGSAAAAGIGTQGSLRYQAQHHQQEVEDQAKQHQADMAVQAHFYQRHMAGQAHFYQRHMAGQAQRHQAAMAVQAHFYQQHMAAQAQHHRAEIDRLSERLGVMENSMHSLVSSGGHAGGGHDAHADGGHAHGGHG